MGEAGANAGRSRRRDRGPSPVPPAVPAPAGIVTHKDWPLVVEYAGTRQYPEGLRREIVDRVMRLEGEQTRLLAFLAALLREHEALGAERVPPGRMVVNWDAGSLCFRVQRDVPATAGNVAA